jgi:ADP-ribose pyrophosphatase YjhB (NUDIX family)
MGGARLSDYPQPSVTADIVVFAWDDDSTADNGKAADSAEAEGRPAHTPPIFAQPLELLLIQRGAEPFEGAWALPGGFLNEYEPAGEAAARELFEETGVKGVALEQLYTFSEGRRDPRGWVITCAYVALVSRRTLSVRAGDDAAAARWFTVGYQVLDAGRRALELSSGPERLTAELQLRGAAEPHIVRNEGLAFDHAKMIALALERLGVLEQTVS